MAGVFERVSALSPRRSAFNLSHERKFTCDMGQLIPVLMMEAVPGDHFQIGVELVIRMMPMVAPLLHEVSAFVHYFFVPNRLTWTSWEDFITGGVAGTDATSMITWTPTGGAVTNDDGTATTDNGVASLWDYMGFPTGVIPTGFVPTALTRRGYNLIWNLYYKDQTLDTDNSLDEVKVMQRRWERDFFTSALPWQQRGTAPALPVTGSAVWGAGMFANGSPTGTWASSTVADNKLFVNGATPLQNAKDFFAANTVSLTTFNVSDLRLAFQTQKWLERNARGGYRYIEQLKDHFGVAPRDERLQRPEYIGGCRMPVMMSEVLQTSATGLTGGSTPQGGMAGHGLAAGRDMCASYRVLEHGIVYGILSIMPRSVYSQGVPRPWVKTTKFDYYFPEFAHLSEQPVMRGELYADGVSGDNNTIFGYQGRWNELRYIPSQVMSLMRPGVSGSLSFWHISRNFGSAPALNSTFVKCVPRKDYLAAPSQPACIVNVGNLVKAVRLLPQESDPGLIDH